ncbi:MAG: glutamate--tRNA ligase [Rhodobacteraceae bacterium]|nr:glutamate--tRNA ligase [Paracoccaceae bacterium]
MTTTRFAPSPTGYLHIGNLRAALFNFLIARQQGGTFILRLDDTDPARSKPEYADGIREDLRWLGLDWDQEETQSARLGRYHEVAAQLRLSGQLYECFESPVELDLKRKKQLNMGLPPVYDRAALKLTESEKDALRAERGGYWRFQLDRKRIEWDDGILGPQSIDAASVSDPVLIRADGQVLYTLASVTDDTDMGITNVVRGLDHVTNTATQIQIIEAMGCTLPSFAHHSMLTGPQGEPLSKRLGVLALRDLRASGVEPMAILSLMARLGSSKPVELRQHVNEVIEGFDLKDFNASPTKFDEADLGPLSARYFHAVPVQEMAKELKALGVPDDKAEDFWLAIRENINVRADIAPWWDLCQNGAAPDVANEDVDFVRDALANLPPRPFDQNTWPNWTREMKEKTGRKGKTLFMPLRKALTGSAHGPDMKRLLPLLETIPEV